MADLLNWYTGLLVTAQNMRTGDTWLEKGIFDLATDMGFVGLISGGGVAEHAGTPNLTVDVAALLARSPIGERIRVAGTAIVDCQYDYLTAPTAVTTPGNSRFVDVYVVFDRVGSDPRLDATNTTVFFVQSESFAFEVYQGAEGLAPAAPAGPADGVLLARITLTHGQTTITNAAINTVVKESVVKLEQGAITIEAGTFTEALDLFLAEYEAHVSGAGGNHDANDIEITVDTAVDWADGNDWCTTSPIGVTDAIQTHVVAKLASTTNGASGGHRLGVAQSSYQSGAGVPVLAAGALYARLESMRDAANIYSAVLSSWPGGDSPTNPAAPLNTQLAKVVQDLARSQSHTDQGVQRIGLRGTGFALASWQALGATNLISLFTGLNSATGTDGAAYIGAKASGALSAGTVRSQLDELDTRTNNNREPTLVSTVANAASITITKFSYRIECVGGGDIDLSAPSANMGPNPIVHFVFVNGSGDAVNLRYSMSTIATWNGGTDPFVLGNSYRTWVELQWTGSGWITRSWGINILAAVY